VFNRQALHPSRTVAGGLPAQSVRRWCFMLPAAPDLGLRSPATLLTVTNPDAGLGRRRERMESLTRAGLENSAPEGDQRNHSGGLEKFKPPASRRSAWCWRRAVAGISCFCVQLALS